LEQKERQCASAGHTKTLISSGRPPRRRCHKSLKTHRSGSASFVSPLPTAGWVVLVWPLAIFTRFSMFISGEKRDSLGLSWSLITGNFTDWLGTSFITHTCGTNVEKKG